MAKNTTLKDIAEALGISRMAVSKALNDSSDISPATKEKILNKAKELGYVPNYNAQALKKGKSDEIAIIFNDFYNPYFSVSCYLAYYDLQRLGYKASVIFCDQPNLEIDLINKMITTKYAGVISFVNPSADVCNYFSKKGIPFVLIGMQSTNKNISSVFTDDYQGGQLVGEYFLNNNFERGLYVTNSQSETSYRRYAGFLNILQSNNKELEIASFFPTYTLAKSVYEKVNNTNIDFIFCYSDSIAIEIINYFKDKNYKKNLCIIGFDNLHKYYPIVQPLNSIDTDIQNVIQYSCELISEQIKDEGKIKYISKSFPVTLNILKKHR